MAKEGKKSLCHTDRLSDLHVDLLYRIMSFLPLDDAFRTIILSKTFRLYWKGTRLLKVKNIMEKDGHFYDEVGSVLPWTIEPHDNGLSVFIPKVEADRIMMLMPATVPTCAHNSNYIKLSLMFCQLTIPPINMCCFSNLISLILFFVTADVIQLSTLISKALHLRSLVLVALQTVGSNAIVVDAHELRELEHRSSISPLRLKYLPCLTSAVIHSNIELVSGNCEGSSFLQFCSLLPNVEKLSLSYYAIKSLIDKKILENAEIVAIDSYIRPKMRSYAMYLIRTSLNLRKLDLLSKETYFHAFPGVNARHQLDKDKLLAEIEDGYSRLLKNRQYNVEVVCIREFVSAALTIQKKRNINGGTPP